MPTIRIAAQHLRPGDITAGTGETIVSASIGLSTPKGKVDVTLQKNGDSRHAQWGRNTVITVERK